MKFNEVYIFVEKRKTVITPKEIKKRTMTANKRKNANNDLFAFYVGRPLSYVLTVPFLYLGINPNTISIISLFPLVVAIIIFLFANTQTGWLVGWLMLFLWNILDGVDGNVARYRQKFSKVGSVYDAMSGYLAMVLTFTCAGIVASNSPGGLTVVPPNMYVLIGTLSGTFTIFPRLIMHKMISTLMDSGSVKEVKDKSNFSLAKIVILNVSSVSGGAQVLFLVAIIFDIASVYTIGYFFLNIAVMIISIHSILKENNK